MTTVLKYALRDLHPATVRDLQEKYPEAEIHVALDSDRAEKGLSEAAFWSLIERLDWSKKGDDAAVIEPTVAALAAGPVRLIYEFSDVLSKKLFRLDGLEFALEIGSAAWAEGRYFSPDTFLYARACAVANGRDFYEKLLKNPGLMPKDLAFGALLRAADEAFERKMGGFFDYVPPFPIETFSNQAAWAAAK